MKIITVVGVCILSFILLLALVAMFFVPTQSVVMPGPVASFEECIAAGNPVLETYPEQCKTTDGKTFVRTVSHACQSDASCESGYFCQNGICTEFSPETTCDTDNDCVLIDIMERFSCCYTGACDSVDYSNSKWKAVNTEWFTTNHTTYCPTLSECGPSPGCPVQIINTSFHAVCQAGMCVKTPTSSVSHSCHVSPKYSTASGLADTIEQRCQQKSTQTECQGDPQCQWV